MGSTSVFAPSGASQGLPAVLSYQHAMIAQHERGVYEISWIADSGAGRDLASMKAFQDQGIPSQSLNQFLQSTQNVKFETGNGCVNSNTSINANGSKFGDASFHVMQSCPLVRSLGQIVESGKPFVWLPGQLPFFGLDVNAVQLAADSERLFVADKVDDHVPIFSETMQFEAPYSFGLPAVDAARGDRPSVEEPQPPEVPIVDDPGGDADSEDGDLEPKDRYTRLCKMLHRLNTKDCTFLRIPHVKYVKGVVCTVGGLTQRDMIHLIREGCFQKLLLLANGWHVISSSSRSPGPKVETMLSLLFAMNSVVLSEHFRLDPEAVRTSISILWHF